MALGSRSAKPRRNEHLTHHWPGVVSPPESADFERSAKIWLFDLAPARWRYEESLHLHPAELAKLVTEYLRSHAAAMVRYRRKMGDLGQEGGGSDLVQQIVDMCLRECERSEALQRQVELVQEALEGIAGKKAP